MPPGYSDRLLEQFSDTLTPVWACRVARSFRVQQSVDRNVFRSSRGSRYPEECSNLSNRCNLCENCYKSAAVDTPGLSFSIGRPERALCRLPAHALPLPHTRLLSSKHPRRHGRILVYCSARRDEPSLRLFLTDTIVHQYLIRPSHAVCRSVSAVHSLVRQRRARNVALRVACAFPLPCTTGRQNVV